MPGTKPLDVGSGVVCASFGKDGGWLSLGAVHPRVGFVELNALPIFNERHRGDPAATRRHRAAMTDPRFAFLRVTAPDGTAPQLEADPANPGRPRWHGRFGTTRVEVEAMVGPDPRSIVQRWRLESPMRLRCEAAGRLDRPALAEITEINPPVPTRATTSFEADGSQLVIRSPELPADAGVRSGGGRWRVDGPGSAILLTDDVLGLELTAILDTGVTAGETRSSIDRLRTSAPALRPAAASARRLCVPEALEESASRLAHRAVAYVRGCTCLLAGRNERTILTDHRLLPLSWTRDAYYQALLLLVAGEIEAVADHLRWLWRRCERPDGRWVRSHHANGRRKDLAFQADQQLYPLVELADFWRASGSLPRGVRWTPVVAQAWAAALGEIGSDGLIASGENAADDPAAAPFIAASQVLLWYAARRVGELCAAGALELEPGRFDEVAAAVREAFDRLLVRDGRWLYATDAAGRAVAYHDANDLVTALAPIWGFCSGDDPSWRATMQFALSSENPGFSPGRHGGLGSLHTPGPWTLGDVQAWLVGSLTGEGESAQEALGRLVHVAFEDGMLPEAYSAEDPQLRVRHWFAWPGAAFGGLLLLDHAGLLEERLRAV